ncbi:MAG: hypothetical protein QNJ97_11790 [Myxococcota bacterium]|nr:hypothetical protein [Myxococcota bacterium]
MRKYHRIIGFSLFLTITCVAFVTTAEEQKIAVLPLENTAKLSRAELEYVFDAVLGAVAKVFADQNITLIQKATVSKAFPAKSELLRQCEEACASKVGKELSANMVLAGQVKKLADTTIVVLRLFRTHANTDADTSTLKGLEQIKAAEVTELDVPINRAVARLLRSETEPARPQPAPAQEKEAPFYGTLKAFAQGTKEGDERKKIHQLNAQVFINGRHVGNTPYQDGLPRGMYTVQIRFINNLKKTYKVSIVPGATHAIKAEFIVPLTLEERREIARLQAEAAKKRRAAEQKQQAALRREWNTKRQAWEVEVSPIYKARKPYKLWGSILAGSGAALILGGAIFEGVAHKEDQRARDSAENWEMATDPELQAQYADRVDQHQQNRDINHAIAISSFAVGGAAAVASAIFFFLMPKVPESPAPPPGLKLGKNASAHLTPIISPNTAGLDLTLAF